MVCLSRYPLGWVTRLLVLSLFFALSMVSVAEPGWTKTRVTVALWPVGKPMVSEELIKKFESRNPDIDVVYQEVPQGSVYQEWILVRIAGGSAPDIFAVGDWELNDYIEQGLIAPIKPGYLGFKTPKELTELFEPAVLEKFVIGGEVYGFPQEWNPYMMYYNVDFFEEAGLVRPGREGFSLTLFLESAKKVIRYSSSGAITKGGMSWDIGHNLIATFMWSGILKSYGGCIIDSNGRVCLNTPYAAKAAELIYDLYNKWKVVGGGDGF